MSCALSWTEAGVAVPCWAWLLLALLVLAWAIVMGVALVALGFYLGSGGSMLERVPLVGTIWKWFNLHFYRPFDVWVLQSFGLQLFDAGAVVHAQNLMTAGMEKAGALCSSGASALAAMLAARAR